MRWPVSPLVRFCAACWCLLERASALNLLGVHAGFGSANRARRVVYKRRVWFTLPQAQPLAGEGPALWAEDAYGGGDRGGEGCTGTCCTKTGRGGVWAGRGDGYDTSTIGNVTIEWLKHLKETEDDTPFFVYFAPHAPHSPSTPAPWYADKCAGVTSPRNPAYNYSGPHRTRCTAWPPSGPPACCLAPNVDKSSCYPCPKKDKEGLPPAGQPVEWWDGVDFNELTSCQPYFDESDAQSIDELARKRCCIPALGET